MAHRKQATSPLAKSLVEKGEDQKKIIKLGKSANYRICSLLWATALGRSVLALKLILEKKCLVLSWDLLIKGACKIEFSLLVDPTALGFRAVVMLIARRVTMFSKFYMSEEPTFSRFHILLMVFVASMLLLIFGVRILSVILGWDGLGVSSYLLVIYYSSWKRSNAGMLTALMNRVGDVFILLSIGLITTDGGYNFNITMLHSSTVCTSLLGVIFMARITKRAQIPFSSWLPAAMAAPTPVSSLVHSSTLVTAGVYLIVRFQSALSPNKGVLMLILYVGTVTIIIAGIRALAEVDMKKIVALSTLSQLGLIMSRIGINQWLLGYFHIVAHAFTKALLFVRVGNIIHSSNDYQDLRLAKIDCKSIPISSSLLLVTNLSLIGFPFISRFYSKDAWLERSARSRIPFLTYALFMLAVLITCLYSARIIYFLVIRIIETSAASGEYEDNFEFKHSVVGLWLISMVTGSAMRWGVFSCPFFVFIPLEVKIFTIKLIFVRCLLYFVVFCRSLGGIKESTFWVRKNIWGLPLISSFMLLKTGLVLSATLFWFLEKSRINSSIITGVYDDSISRYKYDGSWGEFKPVPMIIRVLIAMAILTIW